MRGSVQNLSAHVPGAMIASHAALLLAATTFWISVFSLPAIALACDPALLLTGKLVCLLAALMVFAPRALYGAGHAHGAAALDDQQLAGLLMIAACPLSYLVRPRSCHGRAGRAGMRNRRLRRAGAKRLIAHAHLPAANPAHDPPGILRRRRARAARLPVPVVGRLHGCGKPRALGRHRMAADLRDAQLGEDACLRHRGAAARQRPTS